MSKIFSTEDGELNESVRVLRQRQYSDIDLTFFARTATDGDVYKKNDAAAVKQAIKNLLLTNRFEKPYRPEYGADLSGLLFELADDQTGDEIVEKIKNSIQRYEPRARILGIRVTSTLNTNTINVTIEFRVINTETTDTLKLDLVPQGGLAISLPVAGPPIIYNNRILSEASDKLLTETRQYIVRDIGEDEFDGYILTQDGDPILTIESDLALSVQNYP